MVTPELKNYISGQLGQGKNTEEIKSTLLTKGWRQEDVENAFAEILPASPAPIQTEPETPTTSPMIQPVGQTTIPASQPATENPALQTEPAASLETVQPQAAAVATMSQPQNQTGSLTDIKAPGGPATLNPNPAQPVSYLQEPETINPAADQNPQPPNASLPNTMEQLPNPNQNDISSIDPYTQGAKKKKLLVTGAIIFIGGLSFIGYNLYLSPKAVILRAFKKLATVKTFEYDSSLNMSTVDTGNIDLSLNGAVDANDTKNIKTSFSLKLDAKPTISQTITADMIAVNEELYLKFGTLNVLTPYFELFAPGFKPDTLQSQWIKIDGKTITEKYSENQNVKDGQLTEDQKKKIKKAFDKNSPVKISKTLKSEKINGQDTNHYAFEIDKEALKKLTADVENILEIKEKTPTSDIDNFFKDSNISGTEIWIGKKDKLPAKVAMTLSDKKDAKNKVDFSFGAKNYNKKMDIKAPTSYKTLEEAMKMLMSSYAEGNPQIKL